MRLQQPIWPRFLPSGTVLACATLGPLGRKLRAPGTWGSVAGLLYFTIFFEPWGSLHPIDIVKMLLFSAGGAYLAVALCGEAEFRLGRKDPGEVVLDEFVAMPLCFIGWEQVAIGLGAHKALVFLAGFGLFRLFDIVKPFGIRRLQSLPGGWGVVMDDLVAALAACATMHLATYLWMVAR